MSTANQNLPKTISRKSIRNMIDNSMFTCIIIHVYHINFFHTTPLFFYRLIKSAMVVFHKVDFLLFRPSAWSRIAWGTASVWRNTTSANVCPSHTGGRLTDGWTDWFKSIVREYLCGTLFFPQSIKVLKWDHSENVCLCLTGASWWLMIQMDCENWNNYKLICKMTIKQAWVSTECLTSS